MTHASQFRLQRLAEAKAASSPYIVRHKCFISYHAADTAEVEQFIEDFGDAFIAKTVGVTDEDAFIDSDDTGYIMDRIRTKYLGDSTVTIALIGACTWARRYVDWEIDSSLRSSKHSSINGLMAVTLPSAAGLAGRRLPDRLSDNVESDADGNSVGYARWWKYPSTESKLRTYIEDAYQARTLRSNLRDNTRARKIRSSQCG